MQLSEHQHPVTFTATGDIEADFRYAAEGYEADIARLLPADKSAAILDVGCGWGQCLWWLRSKGYTNLTGIDVGSEQEAQGRSLGLEVTKVEDTAAYLDAYRERFDLIVMNHVIEHMPAAVGIVLLRKIRDALRPGGRAIIQTPNMNCIGAHTGRYIEVSHVTGYTESSLSQIMGIAGFVDVELFGNQSRFSARPRRLVWWTLQRCSRLLWKLLLLAELGTDTPKILAKNIYATGRR
jgi:SAM-dependent methyltransferase